MGKRIGISSTRQAGMGLDQLIFIVAVTTKGETITVIHTTDGYLFGGYTDVPWSSQGTRKPSSVSFLFAFRSSALGKTPVKTTIVDSREAVYTSPGYCFAFGGGYNIYLASSSNTILNSGSNWDNGLSYSYQRLLACWTSRLSDTRC